MLKKKKQKKMNSFSIGSLINYTLLTLLVAVCVYPFLNVVAYSLSSNRAVLSGEITFYPIDFQLDAYKEIIYRGQIWLSIRVTTIVTVLGTGLGLILTVLAAYALSKKKLKGRAWITGLILFTMYFSGGIIPTFMVVKNLGLYNHLTALYIQVLSVFLISSSCEPSFASFPRVWRRRLIWTVPMISQS